MDLPEWVDELWSELRFAELAARESGEGFQRLFQRVMKAADGESFLEVRPVGKYGDFKCDGWDTSSQTCYAVYGPFTRKTPDEVREKIESDLHGALRAWPEMRNWRFVHNDQAGLSALVAAALVSLRDDPDPAARHVTLLPPWGPKGLWWLLRQAPVDARASLLGTQPWSLNRRQFESFADAGEDPVSVSAGRSVAQLIHGFADGGLVAPLTGTAFAGTLAMFLLGDENAFRGEAVLLEQRCRTDPFETMVTAVMFCVLGVQMWEEATGRQPEAWAETGMTVPYITQIVLSARAGTDPGRPPSRPPGRPAESRDEPRAGDRDDAPRNRHARTSPADLRTSGPHHPRAKNSRPDDPARSHTGLTVNSGDPCQSAEPAPVTEIRCPMTVHICPSVTAARCRSSRRRP